MSALPTFEEIELAARRELPIKTPSGVAALCHRAMRDLYRRFRTREISHETAVMAKTDIRGEYAQSNVDQAYYAAAYAQYQENIRNAGGAWETIVKDAQGMTDAQLVDRLLEILSRMVGEGVTADAVRKAIRR